MVQDANVVLSGEWYTETAGQAPPAKRIFQNKQNKEEDKYDCIG